MFPTAPCVDCENRQIAGQTLPQPVRIASREIASKFFEKVDSNPPAA